MTAKKHIQEQFIRNDDGPFDCESEWYELQINDIMQPISVKMENFLLTQNLKQKFSGEKKKYTYIYMLSNFDS